MNILKQTTKINYILKTPLYMLTILRKVLVPRPNATRKQFEGAEVARTTRFFGDVSSEGFIFMVRSPVFGSTPTAPPLSRANPPNCVGRPSKSAQGPTGPPKCVGGPSKIVSGPSRTPQNAWEVPQKSLLGPKMAPRWPKMASRWPQDGPRWPPNGPR